MNKQYINVNSAADKRYNSCHTTSYKFNLTTRFRILVERLRGSEGDNVISGRPSTSVSLTTGELAIGTV